MNHLATLGCIGLGGALGACSRYLITLGCTALLGKAFPYGTLLVNVLGSLCMGLALAAMQEGLLSAAPWRPILTIGFLGALTTFSTFSMDNVELLQQGATLKLGANILLNVVVCFGAAWGGFHGLLWFTRP